MPFGKHDPQFGIDIGFFVFTLPWLQFITGFLTAVVFLAALAALVTHYLYGGIRLQGGGPAAHPGRADAPRRCWRPPSCCCAASTTGSAGTR